MTYPFRPRFVYGPTGSQTDVTLSLPSRAWEYQMPTVGGSRTAASGVPAAHVVRSDMNLVLPIRFRETEWLDVLGVIQWGQLAESFLYYPDAGGTVIASARTVYLEHPQASELLEPQRDDDFPRVRELTITLRKADQTAWDFEFYANP